MNNRLDDFKSTAEIQTRLDDFYYEFDCEGADIEDLVHFLGIKVIYDHSLECEHDCSFDEVNQQIYIYLNLDMCPEIVRPFAYRFYLALELAYILLYPHLMNETFDKDDFSNLVNFSAYNAALMIAMPETEFMELVVTTMDDGYVDIHELLDYYRYPIEVIKDRAKRLGLIE